MGKALRVVVRSRGRSVCVGCGGGERLKEERDVGVTDLPVFGRPMRLVWRKRCWECPDGGCGVGPVS